MVADDPQHLLAILHEAREGPALARHFGGGGVAHAGHDGRERAGHGPSRLAVVGYARRHQQAADIGVAKAERAIFVGELGDFLRGETAPSAPKSPAPPSTAARRVVTVDIDALGFDIAELQQVQRSEIAGGVVEEHIFRARIGGADVAAAGQVCQSLMVVWNWMPGSAEAQAA